ncbi:hypothetical protein PO878_04360 [Iamia majanohamensis]|uniref:Uncharacterized protein n=1 Tax=Iamia majanohamensis TaxID=467976 RepID=A0AAE9Y6R4_9ACTN|nr:hypothetical protein [Iamia majanohamensis]WCO67955.1 hypothetical protein PO878_04360 [Iamia majanohamensis]
MSNIDEQLDPIIDAHLRHLEGGGPAPDLAALPDGLREEAEARVILLEATWGTQVTAPPDDPVARRFGFDRAGGIIAIDGHRVAAIRKAAGYDLAKLLARVTAAGGDIAIGTLFRLEQSDSMPLSQPNASALVAALGTNLSALEAAVDIDLGAIRAFLDSPAFYDLVDSWAAEHQRESDEVRSVVEERVLALQYRAEGVTTDHLTTIVQTILRSLEP